MGNIVGIRCKSCMNLVLEASELSKRLFEPSNGLQNRRNGCLDPQTAFKTVETAVWPLKRPPKPSKRLFGPSNGLQNRRNGCLDPQTAFRTLQTAFRTPKRPPKRVFFTFFSSSTDPWTVRHIFKVFQNFTCFFTDPIPGYHIFDLFFENLTQNMIPRYRTAQKTLKILKNVKNMTPRSRICCRPEKSEKNRKKRVLGLFGPPNGLPDPQNGSGTPT